MSPFDLFFTRCPCGELTVHGFWDQLKLKVIDRARKRAVVVLRCGACGRPRVRRFRLTTGYPFRRRLVNWVGLFWRAVPYIPRRWFRAAAWLALQLETRFPI